MSNPSNQAKEIFLAAIEEHAPQQWPAFLEQACAGDAPLRAEVEKLLHARAEMGSFHEASSPALFATIDEPIYEALGAVIGSYKLMEQIGEGGMGLVFVAEQQHPIRRKVALKIIKPGMDTRQVVARFEAERQALALMDHPNIAKVLDGGVIGAPSDVSRRVAESSETRRLTSLGSPRPYFVMELVKGVPITEYCDQNQIPVRERLELFLDVCQAVQHAHQKGIIHRDIKPSNVLVMSQDGTPLVKVIDFGVAKAIGQQLTDKTIYTQFSQLVGTPLYMSPEQAGQSGLDVDTRTDIYALGVLLYELLTGTTPFDKERLKEADYDEIRRIIREEEPPKPSTRISTMGQASTTISTQRKSDPKRLSQLFRGELDWIVMKALEKDRNRRYESASAFAADVQRYLKDEPVLACPPSAWYRLRKFARRHKAGLGIAALTLLLILLVGGGSGWVLRDRAMREEAFDDQMDRALTEAELLIQDLKWPEALPILKRTEQLWEAAGRPRERPERLEKLHKDLAMVQRLEDIYARPKQEAFWIGQEQDDAYAKAFQEYGIDVAELPITEAAERIRSRRIRRELTRALDFWSFMRRRVNNQKAPEWKVLLELATAADPDPWRTQLRQCLVRDDRKALHELAASADVGKLPPSNLVLLGWSLNDAGALDKAVALLRRGQREHPGDLWVNDALGFFYMKCVQPPQYDEALRFYSIALGLRPANPYMMHQVGLALQGKGELEDAVASYSKAIDLRPDFWEAWWRRAEIYVKMGQGKQALAELSHVIDRNPTDTIAWLARGAAYNQMHDYKKALADVNKSIELAPKYAAARSGRALVYFNLGKWDKALVDCSKAIELNPASGEAWNTRGAAYCKLNQWEKAITALNKAIELDPRMAEAWNNRGSACTKLRQFDKALADLNKAIHLDPRMARAWNNRGWAYSQLRQFDKALADLNKAIDLDPKDPMAWNHRGVCHSAMEHWEKAHVDSSKALELDPDSPVLQNNLSWVLATRPEAKLRDPHRAVELAGKAVKAAPREGVVWTTLGVARYRAGDSKGAVAALQEALKHFQVAGGFNRGVGRSLFFLAMAQQQLGSTKEARQVYDRALEWLESNRKALESTPWAGVELRRFQAEAEEVLGIERKGKDGEKQNR
jgi:tetratricopeptide (TPR) repeat protein